MASSPPKPPKPDPATIASTPGEQAKKRQELRNRSQGKFYSGFYNIRPPEQIGGGNQTVG